MLISGWQTPLELLREELIQLEQEGRVVPDSLRKEVETLVAEKEPWAARIEEVAAQLTGLQMRPEWPYEEPDELDEIRRLRPAGPRVLSLNLSDGEMLERFHGAWRGRCVGCALGRPVEGKTRDWIRTLLIARGEWELNDFFRGGDSRLWAPASQRENIRCMEPDDDIHYTLIGLRVMEKKGADFRWDDIANCWNSHLPYNAICTAETQAILNYNMLHPRCSGYAPSIATPEFTRRHNNPYREWIGAAIRADFWGYAAAGNPELAAEFAYRDGSWTHVKNGIYSEMFVAALISAAFVESDPVRLVEIGLSEIPANCRIAEAVRRALEWRKECADWESFMEKIDRHYGTLSWVHSINNLLIVLMALFYGDSTIDRNTALAVMGGADTDCNGATAGSITGILNPVSRLAERQNDTVEPQFIGEGTCRMRKLAERTLAVWKQIRNR